MFYDQFQSHVSWVPAINAMQRNATQRDATQRDASQRSVQDTKITSYRGAETQVAPIKALTCYTGVTVKLVHSEHFGDRAIPSL